MYRAIFAFLAVSLTCSGCGSFFYAGQQPSVSYRPPSDHMNESIRQHVHTVEVIADASKPALSIGGDYGQATTSTGEGASEGAAAGLEATSDMINEDPRTILLAPIALPVFLITGTIAGASAAKIEQQLQKFRDSLANEIATESVLPLSGDTVAARLDSRIESIADVTRSADDADVLLQITLKQIRIETEDEDAIVSVSAEAVLQSRADGTELYRKTFDYKERDSLRSWANSDDARWSDFAVAANGYLAAEIAADLFETIHVRNVLRPAGSQTFSGSWQGRVFSATPTLAWELFLLGGDEYRDRINRADIRFDLRIFDAGRLVYEARNIAGTSHTVAEALPACRSLRWTVRPVYRIDGKTRAGEWMTFRSGTDKFWHNASVQSLPGSPEFWAYYAGIGARCAS